ncbi:hypothetical protein L1987_80218 [Smallanthus sonchifolius]|uniref:Uncharacterized protein n=1 Tax=Smallanthus sonchifolius TaxID=185202 RepID=A0ACB8YMH0_9ASTR|nr:hypothetical protein L1987_80218 [Smallanthus sonchifolius]
MLEPWIGIAVIDRRDVPGRETPLHLAVRLKDPISADILTAAVQIGVFKTSTDGVLYKKRFVIGKKKYPSFDMNGIDTNLLLKQIPELRGDIIQA